MCRALRDTVGSEVMEECIEEGRRATERRRQGCGGNSFGPSAKDLQQARHTLSVRARSAHLDSVGEDGAIDQLMNDATVHEYSVEEAVAIAKRLQGDLHRRRRAEEKKD